MSNEFLDNTINDFSVNLATGIGSGDTSLSLVSGGAAQAPAVPFVGTLYNDTDYKDRPDLDPDVERIRFTVAPSGDTFGSGLTRGYDGSTAVNHNTAGKSYKLINGPTSSMITQIDKTFGKVPSGLDAAKPSSPTGGAQFYFSTDIPALNFWNGTSWFIISLS